MNRTVAVDVHGSGTDGGSNTRGTLLITTSAAATLGIPAATPTAYDRLIVNGGLTNILGSTGAAVALGGITKNGTSVTQTGILPPWIIDTTDNTFVGYNPTNGAIGGGDTGFQPLIAYSSSALAAGQIGYNSNSMINFNNQ